MEIEKIRALCIESCNIYYDYLDKNDKGIYSIGIRNIVTEDKNVVKLKITGKIFDLDTVVFQYLPEDKEWSTTEIKVQIYDRDTNTLILKPNNEIHDLFAKSHHKGWLIKSDLKFLIERVKEWYEMNGHKITIPTMAPKLDPPDDSLFFQNEVPSDEQQKALKSIFSHSLNYIWGAPGTGKTQFVLSYAILHYLANKKKVAIVAPTNHALEQIFRGLIKMTDKAGIKRNNILRLGGPSKKFADDFPEICEILGLENQLKKVEEQIAIIENILGIDEYSKELLLLRESLNLLRTLLAEQERNQKIATERNQLVDQIKTLKSSKQESLYSLELVDKGIHKLQRKQTSIGYRLMSAFIKKIDFDVEQEKLIKKKVALENSILEIDDALERVTSKAQIKHSEHLESDSLQKNIIAKIESNPIGIQLSGSSLSVGSDLSQILHQTEERVQAFEAKNSEYISLADEYKHLNESELADKLSKLNGERLRLENHSTKERLRNVSIVGATLDTYLHRFKSESLNVDHIFLDEAGYSSIIKALTLFNQGVPITLLGDHMQLPPVCELSKRNIEENDEFREVFIWDQSAIYLENLFDLESVDQCVKQHLANLECPFKILKKDNLTQTYRFGSELANVLQQYVYQSGFSSKADRETEIIVCHIDNPPGFRQNTRKSEPEISAIETLVQNNYNPDSDLVILTPYSIQVKELDKVLPEFHYNNRIMTVHKSQGQEWDTVIYSPCDPGNGRTPWFTDSTNPISNGLNNINTAISRAKRRLIIVCDSNEWNKDERQLITGLVRIARKIELQTQ